MFACRAFDNMAGGVERMACAMMEEMHNRGHEVTLLTWDNESASAFYDMNSSIRWFRLDLGNHQMKASFFTRLKRAIKIRKILKLSNPDVILAFQQGIFFSIRIYSIGLGIPIIAAERNAPSRFDHLKAGRYKKILFQSFRLASAITIQIENYRNHYPDYLHNKIVSIPNPVYPAKNIPSEIEKDIDVKILLSVGRLCYQKNYDVLIDAFTKIFERFPEWILQIAGEGEDREKLQDLIKIRNVQDRVRLLGAVNDVDSLYGKASLFCLPSRWEGFPNALAEAMTYGLPAVGFQGCAGVRDIIENNQTGILVEGNGDVDSLAEGLSRFMADEQLRKNIGKKALSGMSVYNPEIIFDQWEKLFSTIAFK